MTMAGDVVPDTTWWSGERLARLNDAFRSQSPRALLHWGLDRFGDRMVLGTGFGPSGIVLMHMASQLQPRLTVFYLDTALLFPETYALREQIEERLGIELVRVPASLTLGEQAAERGPALWQHAPDSCCHLRKVIPLRRYLADKAAWVTGLRRDQSATRASTQLVEWSENNGVLKLNPLAFWSEAQVWAYIDEYKLPVNALHEEGYRSIGCLPCTRAVRSGEHARAGRWAGRAKLECGIHIERGQIRRRSK